MATKKTKKNRISKIRRDNKKLLELTIRYFILLGIVSFSLPLIYSIFTPLTIYPSSFLLDLFYEISVNEDIIVINSITFVQIIPACVGGSAYLLLIILNLSLDMGFRKRIYALLLSFISLLVLNVLRIFILASWYHNRFLLFEVTHAVFWYVFSTLFVVIIWFLIVRIFSIKKIPVITDMKFLIENIKL